MTYLLVLDTTNPIILLQDIISSRLNSNVKYYEESVQLPIPMYVTLILNFKKFLQDSSKFF